MKHELENVQQNIIQYKVCNGGGNCRKRVPRLVFLAGYVVETRRAEQTRSLEGYSSSPRAPASSLETKNWEASDSKAETAMTL